MITSGPCITCGLYGCKGHDPGPLYAELLKANGGNEEALKPSRGVVRSEEFERIKALPRRDWEARDQSHVEAFFMQHLRAPGGTQRLRPVQIAALWEMHDRRGLFVQVRTGGGKTILSLLGFLVLNSMRPLLIVPAALKEKTLRDMQRYRKDWLVPAYIRIISYELIGRPQSAGILEEYKPDVVIMDEAHRAKSASSAVTKRLKEYFLAYPDTKVVAMSGTIAKRSIKDYAHIADWCLREKSPVPRDFKVLQQWSSALDDEKNFVTEDGERTFGDDNQSLEPGVLLELCSQEELAEPDRLRGVRKAYRRRLTDTPGVIATQESALGVGLQINPMIIKDAAITQAAANMRASWERPDGAEFFDTLEMWRHLRTLSVGFYHRWNPAPPDEWRSARRDWAAIVREILRTNRRGLHSEVPVREAVAAGEYGQDVLKILQTWREQEPRYDPEKNKEAIWISRGAIDAAIIWASKNPGLIWVSYPEFGNALSKITGIPFYWNKGLDAKGRFIEDHPKKTPMIASLHANSAGLNLQYGRSKMLYTSFPTTGLAAEQCLDSETEILTEVGWKGIDSDWPEGTRAAAYDIGDGSIHWSPAKRVERTLGSEAVYGIANRHLDIRVTAGHRMVVQRRRRLGRNAGDGHEYLDRAFIQADSMPRMGKIPIAGMQEAQGVPLSDADLMFIGLFMSDGHLDARTKSIQLFQSDRYPYVITNIKKTLRECGFRYSVAVNRRPSNYGPRKYALNSWYVPYGERQRLRKAAADGTGWARLEPYIDKELPESLMEMTRDQLIVFLVGMWLGDGSKLREYDGHKINTCTIGTSRKIVADKLQSLCLRRGLRCNVCVSKSKGRKSAYYNIHVLDQVDWTFMRGVVDARARWEQKPSAPTERFWCATVDTGAIVTRRNGRPAIVGNSISRVHREGQPDDEVVVDVGASIPENLTDFDQACADARRATDMEGQEQRLCYADITIPPPHERGGLWQ